MYTSSTIMNFILEGKICFTETEWKCKTSLADAVLIFHFQCITADSQDTLITAGHRDWNTTLETQS